MGSKGSFTGSHRKLKCCLMRIIRYLNQKWVCSGRSNHCTPSAEHTTSRAVSTSVHWLLDWCLCVIYEQNHGGNNNNKITKLVKANLQKKRSHKGKHKNQRATRSHTEETHEDTKLEAIAHLQRTWCRPVQVLYACSFNLWCHMLASPLLSRRCMIPLSPPPLPAPSLFSPLLPHRPLNLE